MIEENIWRTKLQYFFEGLQMENIDELMDKPPIALKLIGSVMAGEIDKLKTITRSFDKTPPMRCVRSDVCDMKRSGCMDTCFVYQSFIV